MSLLVWLPLTKDLKNLGLSNVTITNTNAALSTTEGKLGGSYYFNGSARIQISKPAELTSLKNSTITAWVKSTSSTFALGGISMDKGNNESTPSCTMYGDNWQLTNNSAWKYFGGGAVTNKAAWKHVAITISDTTGTTYLDGNVVNTFSLSDNGIITELNANNFIEIGSDYPGGNEFLTGYINDFRVYNHCLSKKEIAEISKGLCLHYQLKGTGTNANLLSTSTIGSNPTVTDTALNKTVYERTNSTTSENYLFSSRTPQIKPSTKYTFSAMVYVNEYVSSIEFFWLSDTTTDKKTGGNFVNVTNLPNLHPIPGRWQKMTWTFTTKANDYTGYIRIDNNGTKEAGINAVLRMCNLKLEEGDKATPWCPNSADTLYSKLGYNSTTEYDVSGMGQDATKVNSPVTDNTSSRYLTSLLFNNTNQYIISNPLTTIGYKDNFTISWWGKCSVLEGKMAWGWVDGNRLNVYPTGGAFCWNTGDSGSNPFKNNGTSVAFASYQDNNWHHYAVTGNGTTNTLYIDGVLKGNSTTYKGITGTKLVISGWDTGTNYKWSGNLSDFRIYATVLSADDIKALYNNPIGIDKNGGLHCMEVIEE